MGNRKKKCFIEQRKGAVVCWKILLFQSKTKVEKLSLLIIVCVYSHKMIDSLRL